MVQSDVPTCRIDERVGDVQARVAASAWNTAIVINDERVILGRMFKEELAGPPDGVVADVMRPGPTTHRIDSTVTEILEHMSKRDLHTALVSDTEGHLVGMARRKDLEEALKQQIHRQHQGHNGA